MLKVTLSNGVSFECASDQTILEAARTNEIAIEHSCRNGRCGICAAVVLEGETVALNPEDPNAGLDLASKEVLTCCRAPLSDIALDIEDLGEIGKINSRTLPCRVDALNFLAPDVVEVILRLPPDADFHFVPGQYINLIGQHGVKRSYSIANAPSADKKLSLHIKRVNGGVMSDYLFERAKVNDLMRLEGPLGTFSYRDNDSTQIVFLATGTGIAPVKALLQDLGNKGLDKDIWVIWGGRVLTDLYWDSSLNTLPHQFVPVLSRQSDWMGFSGYVQEALLDLQLDLESTTVYACGSDQMIRDASRCLVENGLPRQRFYSDAFVSSS